MQFMVKRFVQVNRGQPRVFRQGEVLQHFQDFGEKFGPNFGFLYMFYTFKLLPQLKIERSEAAKGYFFSLITP